MKSSKTLLKIKIAISSALMLMYSAMLQFSLPSVVLCVGADGHIAIEQSEAQCRGNDPDLHENHVADVHANLAHQQTDCADLPLVKLFSLPFIDKEINSKYFISPAVITADFTHNTFSASKIGGNSGLAGINPTRKNLQSVVLLI